MCLSAFVSALGSHEIGRYKLPIIMMMMVVMMMMMGENVPPTHVKFGKCGGDHVFERFTGTFVFVTHV